MINHDKDTFEFFHFRQALAIAFAVAVVTFVTIALNIRYSFIATVVIMVVAFTYPHNILKMSWQFFLGSLIGFLLAFILFTNIHSLFISILMFFAVNFVIIYLFNLGIYPYTCLITSIVFSLFLFYGFNNLNGGINFTYHWVINTAFGLLALVLVKSWVFRDRIKETFAYEKLQILETLRKLCENPGKQIESPLSSIEKLNIFVQLYLEKELSCSSWTFHAKRLYLKLEVIRSHYSFLKSIDPLAPFFDAFFANLFSNSLEKTLSELDNAFETLRQQKYFMKFSTQDLLLISRLRLQSHECFKEREGMIAAPTDKVVPLKPLPPTTGDQLRTALTKSFKISLGPLLTLLLSIYLGLPGGLQAIFTVIIILAQPNIGKASLWAALRLGGTCLGAALSVLYILILSYLPHLWIMIALYSFSILILYYMGYTSSLYNYLFLQAGVALTLIFLVDIDGIGNLASVIQRFIGVIIGFVVGTFLNYLITTDDPLKAANDACSKQLQLIANYLKATFIENRPHEVPKNLFEAISIKELHFTFGIHTDTVDILEKQIQILKEMRSLFELLDPLRMLNFPKLEIEGTHQLQKGISILIRACEGPIDLKELLHTKTIFRDLLTGLRQQEKMSSWPIASVTLLFDSIFMLEECCDLLYQIKQSNAGEPSSYATQKSLQYT